jgi:hypothetical protein
MRPRRAERANRRAARRGRKRRPKAREAAAPSQGANKLKPTVYITAVSALMPPSAQAS